MAQAFGSRDKFTLLLLGGGKRVGLIKSFESAAKAQGLEFQCVTYENSPFVPASLVADVQLGLAWRDPKVSDNIASLIAERKIDWVCACVDPATLLLERIRDAALPGLLTSSEEMCGKLLDKVQGNTLAGQAGLDVIPESVTPPIFVKSRNGSASKGARAVYSQTQLAAYKEQYGADDLMLQQLCSGPEFTIDCFATAATVLASPRLRLETSGGEAIRTQTVRRPDLVEMATRFIRAHGLLGPLTVQFIEHDGKPLFMECNPRFGGGVLCSIRRGFDYPALIVALSKSRPLPALTFGPEVLMSRYFAEAYFELAE